MGDMTGTFAPALTTLDTMKRGGSIWGLVMCGGALGLVSLAAPASAQPSLVSGPRRLDGPAPDPPKSAMSSRATSTVQLGTALLALPATEVCPHGADSCQPGETSIAVSLKNLGRFGDFAFGAGITWAFGLRPADAVGGEALGQSLQREHSRSYFAFEGLFRYHLAGPGAWQWWVGATLGGVVVNDSWSTSADRDPYADTAFVGPRGITLATEGLAVGLAAGAHWRFADEFVFGGRMRYANWLFPDEREVSPLGDSASLAGRVDVVDVGLTIGYLLPL